MNFRSIERMRFVVGLSVTGLGVNLGSVVFHSNPVVFESLESKTASGGPVFNRIQLLAAAGHETWIMQQSHHGLQPEFERWDRVAIVVDKEKRSATFYELAPGPLAFEPKPVPYKARCFACHPNGPRAIRWNPGSRAFDMGLRERAQIIWWNFKIARYGQLRSLPAARFIEGAPFRSELAILERPLALASCSKCHSRSGNRAELVLENLASARFLVESGAMPPFPFHISKKDRRRLLELSGEPFSEPL